MSTALRVASGLAIAAGLVALALPFFWSPGAADVDAASSANALFGFAVLLAEVFAFHGGLALLAMAAIALLSKERTASAALLALGLVHAGPGVVAAITPAPAAAVAVETPSLTVVAHNLLYSRADLDALAVIIERERPDAVMLQEVVSDRAHEIVERFGGAYPHIVWPNTHRWGGMLLSRRPFVDSPDALPGQEGWRIDQPAGVIEFDGTRVTLMSVHLPAPNSVRQLVAGPQMSDRLAAWVRGREGEAIVLAGDFNAPLWTTRMTPLRRVGIECAHDAIGGGRGATWPARTPLRFAPGIRLDHAAFVGGLRCIESRVLEPTGSDHRPILARFVRAPDGPAD